MKILLQRVKWAKLSIEGKLYSEIGPGLVALVGIGKEDDEQKARHLAQKTAKLRIFSDAEGKFNYAALDLGKEILAVSQFTLYANCAKGLRPAFDEAASQATAKELYLTYVDELVKTGLTIKSGVFQADMLVEIANDGPVTIMLEK